MYSPQDSSRDAVQFSPLSPSLDGGLAGFSGMAILVSGSFGGLRRERDVISLICGTLIEIPGGSMTLGAVSLESGNFWVGFEAPVGIIVSPPD